MKNIFICFDPGNEKTAMIVAEWNGSKENSKLLYKGKKENSTIYKEFLNFINKYKNNIAKIVQEYPSSYGMPVGQTIFDTCCFCGIIIQICKQNNLPTELVFRKSTKMFLCDSVRAKDSEVNLRVREYLGEDYTIKNPNLFYWNEEVEKNQGDRYCNNDIYAALAVFLYTVFPHDILIQNEKEQERNKIAQELQKIIKS